VVVEFPAVHVAAVSQADALFGPLLAGPAGGAAGGRIEAARSEAEVR
jgi:hypothetical protein